VVTPHSWTPYSSIQRNGALIAIRKIRALQLPKVLSAPVSLRAKRSMMAQVPLHGYYQERCPPRSHHCRPWHSNSVSLSLGSRTPRYRCLKECCR
jgi:hypothetical protein